MHDGEKEYLIEIRNISVGFMSELHKQGIFRGEKYNLISKQITLLDYFILKYVDEEE